MQDANANGTLSIQPTANSLLKSIWFSKVENVAE